MTTSLDDKVGRDQEAEKSGSRRRILQAALLEFAQHGLSGTRVDRIAARAGVNKAMIYYHFDSKDDLFDKVIEDHFSTLQPVLRERISDDDGLEAAMTKIAVFYADIFPAHPHFKRIFVREIANQNHAMLQRVVSLFSSSGLPDRLLRLFEECLARGEMRDVNIRQTAVSFISMNICYFLLQPLFDHLLETDSPETEQFIRQRKEAVVDLFLYGVKPR